MILIQSGESSKKELEELARIVLVFEGESRLMLFYSKFKPFPEFYLSIYEFKVLILRPNARFLW